MKKFFIQYKKILTSIAFTITFIYTLIYNIPSWILSNVMQHYSSERLRLYDTEGTFWDGSGVLVALSPKLKNGTSLILVNWKIKLGLNKFIDIQFNAGNKKIANVYINRQGLNLDNLDLSLSITQLERTLDIVKNMDVSGNLHVSTDHIQLNSRAITGQLAVNLDNVSSGMSKVNPLGSYTVQISMNEGNIVVNSNSDSILNLSGNGTINSLILSAKVNQNEKEDMLQFITVLGAPKPDGSYELKIF